MMGKSPAAGAPLVVLALLSVAAPAYSDDVIVMTSGAFAATYLELAPSFERSTKHRLVTSATSMGTGAQAIPARMASGQPVDVVIVAAEALDDLIKRGLVLAGSRVDLARSGIGMAVRVGAPKPDIRSVDGLKRALLEARSIAYSASVSGDYLIRDLFPRLGIANQLKGKSKRIERERVGAVVARGEAEIGFHQISELLPVPGIDLVGPLPAEVQLVTTFSAGVATKSAHPDSARILIRHLASPAASSVVVKSGMEPVAPRSR